MISTFRLRLFLSANGGGIKDVLICFAFALKNKNHTQHLTARSLLLPSPFMWLTHTQRKALRSATHPPCSGKAVGRRVPGFVRITACREGGRHSCDTRRRSGDSPSVAPHRGTSAGTWHLPGFLFITGKAGSVLDPAWLGCNNTHRRPRL